MQIESSPTASQAGGGGSGSWLGAPRREARMALTVVLTVAHRSTWRRGAPHGPCVRRTQNPGIRATEPLASPRSNSRGDTKLPRRRSSFVGDTRNLQGQNEAARRPARGPDDRPGAESARGPKPPRGPPLEGVPSPLRSDSRCTEPAVYTESPALPRTRVRPWATPLGSSARLSGGWSNAEGHLTPTAAGLAAVVAHGAPRGGPGPRPPAGPAAMLPERASRRRVSSPACGRAPSTCPSRARRNDVTYTRAGEDPRSGLRSCCLTTRYAARVCFR